VTDKMLVLLVEDEPLISEFVQALLEDADCSVVTARHGGEAISILDAQLVGALMTDVRLGEGPDGWAVARYARRLKPALPVIYFSGHNDGDWAAEGVPRSTFLQKPLSPPRLARALEAAIAEQA
jgi:DNA-binding NtrC family response regulator